MDGLFSPAATLLSGGNTSGSASQEGWSALMISVFGKPHHKPKPGNAAFAIPDPGTKLRGTVPVVFIARGHVHVPCLMPRTSSGAKSRVANAAQIPDF